MGRGRYIAGPTEPGGGADRLGVRSARWLALALGLILPAAAASVSPISPLSEPAGLAVASVEPASLAERAGLKVGDLLLGWRRGASPPAAPLPSGGPLASPFELDRVLEEEAPRGAVTLLGRRGERERRWTLAAGASVERFGAWARPPLPSGVAPLYASGGGAFAAGRAGDGSRLWREAAAGAYSAGWPEAALWLQRERARALLRARDFPAADAAYAAALVPILTAGAPAARLLLEWARSYDERGLWEEAAGRLERARGALGAEDGAGRGGELLRARLEFALGEVERHRDAYPAARRWHERAFARRRFAAPESLDLAESLFSLARVRSEAAIQGETGAEGLLRAADRMAAGVEAGSPFNARVLDYLAATLWNQGRAQEAEALFAEAYRIALARAPRSYEAARILDHWGNLLDRKGDLRGAEALLSQALSIWRELPPTVLHRRNLAVSWLSLAYLKGALGDLEAAEANARRALEMMEAMQPGSLGEADALDILGFVETGLRRYDEGRRHLTRATELRGSLMPGHPAYAASLTFLGALEVAAGQDLPGAERILRRSDEIHRSFGPATLSQADTLAALALAIERQGRPEEALAQARQALEIRRRLSPGGLAEAESLHQVGEELRRAGRKGSGTKSLCAAAGVIDRIGERMAGSQRARTSFSGASSSYYFDCLEARLEEGKPGEAFRVLEAGRARALLDLFGSRDLELRELPPPLRRERARLREEYARLSERLEETGVSGDRAAFEASRRDLFENQRRNDDLSVRIRAAVPRLASLRFPRPLGLAAARRVLDPGTVLLSYAVGTDRSHLFVVSPAGDAGPGLRVFPVAAGAERLGREVETFRGLLSDPASAPRAIREHGSRLFRLLLAPAGLQIRRARRLLISADGALHLLPFAALVGPDGRYLAEGKPSLKVASATVYGERRSWRRAAGASGDRGPSRPRLGIVGDPAGSDLPGARREMAAVAGIFGSDARILAGSEATEKRVAALAREVDWLHFATHAFVDEGMPLNSALLLAPSIPSPGVPRGREDGRLEAWEIVEDLRLRSGLVVLSACDTGLGKMVKGEGLIGLTRAFQFAGAHAILASLWAVGDGPTARFMPRFYRHLLAGSRKDEALRQAQGDAIREGGHPGGWAAFELTGDFE